MPQLPAGAADPGQVRRVATALLCTGVVGAVLGLSKLHATANAYDYTASARPGWSVLYVALLGVGAYAAGFPEHRGERRQAWTGALAVVTAATVGLSVVQLLAGAPLLPRFVLGGSVAILVPWMVLTARLAADTDRRADSRTRVALVAREDEQALLASELRAEALRVDVVATLTPAAASTVAGASPLLTAAREAHATVLVLSREAQADESVVAQAALLHETGVRVRTLALFYEQWLGKVPVSELERMSLLFDIGEIHRAQYVRAKRAVDVALAALGTIALGLLVPVVAVGNRLTGDRGPLLFRQERVGRGGQRFTMLKLRTMAVDDAGTGEWTRPDDPRVTRMGRWLRATHLDELPQVLNVLRGDLAIVGPRPEQPRYVEELTRKLPFYDLRHLVRPGLTGWAQVCQGYASDEGDALQKLQYEFHYLRHQSLRFDLRIVGRTLRSVLGGPGAGR